MKKTMKAGEFKSKCLKVMDDVNKTKKMVIITKRNRPVAKLVPIDDEQTDIFGCMKGTISIHGDIIEPLGEDWDALN